MSPIAPAETQPLDDLGVDYDVLQVCYFVFCKESVRTHHLTFNHLI